MTTLPTAPPSDVPELRTWLNGGQVPEMVESFSFDADRWRQVTGRQRALYQSTMALLMRRSPRDFHNGVPLSKPIIDGQAVDDHHIFPRDWLKKSGNTEVADSVLNHTLIDKKTNILIGARAPSAYLAEMRHSRKDELEPILASHGLPTDHDGPLFTDRFEDFLTWRLDHLRQELDQVTGSKRKETAESL